VTELTALAFHLTTEARRSFWQTQLPNQNKVTLDDTKIVVQISVSRPQIHGLLPVSKF
jgi:hypothetical protein